VEAALPHNRLRHWRILLLGWRLLVSGLGYDPNYSYDNDGPIYAYGNLLPDQVIANVQTQLNQNGYYSGPITGSIDPATRAAIANYQHDRGLLVTATVDQPTVESLGLG
jgi:hypothetical protein